MSYKINVLEDEKSLNDLLNTYLVKEGYKVTSLYTYQEAMDHIEDEVDMWLLDIMLDEGSGFEIMQELRNIRGDKIPIIIISARNHELDRIIGLEKGCDDYITKPFSAKEVILRVGKLLKRVYIQDEENINIGDYNINTKKRKVYDGNEEIILTTREYQLLMLFVNNIDVAFTREQILDKVWEASFEGTDRVVDDGLRRLRRKLKKLKLETIYGYGYRLEK